MSRYRKLIEASSEPEMILKGEQGEFKAIRFVADTHLGPKYLVVVYREENGEKVIITSYFTSNPKKVTGELVWRV